ncbi:MAG: alpha/beta hydrolase [Actinomycetota bacterium]|nr:alpha/beta hydrolase [Actinomycetota bacterium]
MGPAAFSLFADPSLNFEALLALGSAGYGSSEVGEVITAVTEATVAGPSYQTYADACQRMGDVVAEHAAMALRRGHRTTAAWAFLRASEYYAQVLYFVLGTDAPQREPAIFDTTRQYWESAGRLLEPRIKRVDIPYEGTTIPGYWVSPDSSDTRRPTVILNNGSDAQAVEIWPFGVAAAVQRGYNALTFEGPGQGAMLFERDIPFRHDWEQVITPVVDWLLRRRDVDPDRIALTGWSMGGELVIRAAAFEHRLAAVVSDPGTIDVWAPYEADLGPIADAGPKAVVNKKWREDVVPNLPSPVQFILKKRFEIFTKEAHRSAIAGHLPEDFFDVARAIKRFRITNDIAGRVRAPVLVTNYEGDTFFPGQAEELHQMLRTQNELVTFTAAEGAQYHCAPMAPQRRNEVIYDWLDETLGWRGGRRGDSQLRP